MSAVLKPKFPESPKAAFAAGLPAHRARHSSGATRGDWSYKPPHKARAAKKTAQTGA